MLLRASGEREGVAYAIESVTLADGDAGVAHGTWLRRLTEAAIEGRREDLATLRAGAARAMGAQAVVDALTVAAAFNGITRVADATGIPLDAHTEATTETLREVTGIANFEYARKSARFTPHAR